VACSGQGPVRPIARAPARTSANPSALPSASPSPTWPASYIESLQARSFPGGYIAIGDQMARGAGYTKYHMTWPSQGQLMTGTITIPDGAGRFPVVIVNHGFIPTTRYWVGQDSGIFGDPMARHGFISVAPNYPGYSGSGQLDPSYPAVISQAVADMDLVSSLATLPRADINRVGMIGHSNGGGVSLLVSVVDPRVRAYALFAPVSSDMADNARKWWFGSGSMGSLPSPDAAPDAYAHISPRNYFTASTPAMLFLQGTADQDIPADWTNATVSALRARGVPTSVTWYPGANHDMVGSDLSDAVARAESWMRSHLAQAG
jgi:uncharacterized protein